MTSMVDYYSLLEAKRVLETKKPEYLYEKLVGGHSRPKYVTRLCVGGDLRYGPGMHANLSLTKKSWRWRVRSMWADVPISVRKITNYNGFKVELKKWLWSLDK